VANAHAHGHAGIDVMLIGPLDLSINFDVPLDYTNPKARMAGSRSHRLRLHCTVPDPRKIYAPADFTM
jgi:hypothetical protein